MFLGTIVNTAAVIAGSVIGMILKKGIPEKIKEIIFQGLGLCTIVLGISMALKAQDMLILIFSVLIGGIIGEALHLQEGMDRLGDFFKKRFRSSNSLFTEGMITAFLIFCIGAMTIMGTIDEGVRGDHTLLFTKSVLDGFCAIALAATYGSGVLFSSILLLVFQGMLTLLAVWAQHLFTPVLISQLTAAGGLLVMGIGFNLLQIKKIKLASFLPSLLVVVLLTVIFIRG